MAGNDAKGQRIRMSIRLVDGAGAPAAGDAMIELWQADAEGRYADPEFTGSAVRDGRGWPLCFRDGKARRRTAGPERETAGASH